MRPIYLDNAATTQPLASIADLYKEYAGSLWQNPSALYREAGEVRRRVEEVRRLLSDSFGSPRHRCLFTSGGTEGAAAVIREGVSRRRGGSYVCAGFEHPCVEESFLALRSGGAVVRFAPAERGGQTDPEALLELVDESTLLVSCMHVNNETGALNDVEAIAAAVKRKNPRTLVHVDGVQAFLREPLEDASQIDYYTVSAHKVHALKGTGALFYRTGTPLKPLLHGGGQEMNLRSGTENTLGILALGEAAMFFQEKGADVRRRLTHLHALLTSHFMEMPDASVLTPPKHCSHILCVTFPGLRGETLLHMLEEDGITVSTGSACSSRKGRTRMEKALGVSREEALGAIRISLGAFSTEEEAERLIDAVRTRAAQLRDTIGR
ncbi:MAG: aminotransferase class V-fold PLP-dependent enzyme [Clostridia bacterium]|nr:aminotransferase class V-fold PLP-dependent enzyme [Clostridia bacterium]